MSVRARAVVILIAAVLLCIGLAALVRALAPQGTTTAAHVDAIIVLGAPLDSDGNPSPVLLSRVTEAVREYERGAASHLIVTGGGRSRIPEANVMARAAEAEGVPASAIVQEPAAADTIQNACFSERIMQARGWRTAEVVTSQNHLQRSALIFSHLPLAWRAHVAPPLTAGNAPWYDGPLEVLKTARYLTYGQWAESCRP